MVIYKITNLNNGKIYIGQDSKNRKKYFGSGIHIKSAIKKYGITNFKKEILEICESIEHLNLAEINWIKLLDATNPTVGYNIAVGGNSVMFGRTHTLESKEKMKTSAKTHKNNFKGKTHTPESIELMKESWSKFLNSTDGILFRKNLSTKQTLLKTGIPRTKNAIQAISEGHKNFYQTEKGKLIAQKTKERFKQLHKTEEGKLLQKKMAIGRCKHMYEIDQCFSDGTFIKTWKNILEIREIHKSWSSNISACLRGSRNSAYGFIWKKHN
jgi:group I intron endonuclease